LLLAIDAGNTTTVVGMFDDADLVDHWRIGTHSDRTSDELALLIGNFLRFHGFSFSDDVAGMVISSGVPDVTEALREMCERYFGFEPVVLGPGVKTGVSILYDNPKEVGADRIANAVAAYDQFGGPTIIVDFGTATTCDAVSSDGDYLGGAIAPGVEISLDALFARAAALRRVALVEPRSVLGKSTVESIQAGTVYGFAAQVDGLCDRIEAELGACTIVSTGGLAQLIAPFSRKIEHVEPWLTLQGLRLVFSKNRTDEV